MKKIVIAESSSSVKSVAESLLKKHGYNVICTSDGLQALDVIGQEKPNLVIAGLNLSGLTGLELCRHLAESPSLNNIPVIMLLDSVLDIKKEDLIRAGAKGRMVKPFSPKDLLGIVGTIIGTSELVDDKPAEPHTDGEPVLRNDFEKSDDLSFEPENIDSDKTDRAGNFDMDFDDLFSDKLTLDDNDFTHGTGKKETKNQIQPENKTSKPIDDDDDLDWFLGKVPEEQPENLTETQKSEKNLKSGSNEKTYDFDDDLVFDDMISLGSDNPLADAKPLGGNKQKTSDQPHKNEKDSISLSESDLDRLAEKVAEKLAGSLLKKLDRNLIADTIRSMDNLKTQKL